MADQKLKITIIYADDGNVQVDYDNPGDVNDWETIGILEYAKQLLIYDWNAAVSKPVKP
jgi:hypothetical protein